MAQFNQDLIIFDNDTFKIRYTFSSIANVFGPIGSGNEDATSFDSNYGAFWSAGLESDFPSIPTIVRSKATAGWSYAVAFTPNDFNVNIINDTTIIDVNFNQSDFNGAGKLEANTKYYTELVIDKKASFATSVVAATGILHTSASIFSAAGYRP